MTTGHILFYGGFALLAVTAFLAIIFVIFKPKYRPENAVYYEAASDHTVGFRNGYPTDPVTRRRTTGKHSGTKTDNVTPTDTVVDVPPTEETSDEPIPPTSPAGGPFTSTIGLDYKQVPPTEFDSDPFGDIQM